MVNSPLGKPITDGRKIYGILGKVNSRENLPPFTLNHCFGKNASIGRGDGGAIRGSTGGAPAGRPPPPAPPGAPKYLIPLGFRESEGGQAGKNLAGALRVLLL
jgi:hypothetical protein